MKHSVVRLVLGVLSCVAVGCTTADHGGGSGGKSGGAGGASASAGAGGAVDGGASPGTGGKNTGGSTGSAGAAGAGAGTGGATGAGGGGNTAYTCPAGPFTAPLIPSGVSPTRVTGVPPVDAFNNNGNDFGIIEGPVWLGDALYVSQIANGNGTIPPARILKVTTAGVVSIAVADSGSNGLAIGDSGSLLSANHKVGGIVRFALPAGTPTTVVATYNGARFDSPNDLAVARDGTIFFSDPDSQSGGQHPQPMTRVFRVAAGTNVATPVTDYMNQPNGITLSLDEKALFVSGGNGIVKFPINTNGTVGTGVPIFNSGGGVDGMAMDCAGRLFGAVINTKFVVAIDSGATASTPELGRVTITDNIQGVTNVAFGGADHQTIYITALGNTNGVFQMHMGTPGMPY